MKNFAKCMSLVLVALALAVSFSGCELGATEILKVKIFNNTTIPLTVEKIFNNNGEYTTETEIAANTNITIEMQVHVGGPADASHTTSTAVKAYYVSGATVKYPYPDVMGYGYYEHEDLDYGNVTLTLNFVKTSDDEYVLAPVE